MPTHYLACDLGAETGRLMLGSVSSGSIQLREVHRFPNIPCRTANALHWNIPELFEQVQMGLAKAAELHLNLESISTDSWGLDYILFNDQGQILAPVHHYRDPRTGRGMEKVFSRISWPELFRETGIQMMPINTIFQLAAEDPARLQSAHFLLGIGDAFNHFLGGARKMDLSMASTFQLYNPRTRSWSHKLLQVLELPLQLFPELIEPGQPVGHLKSHLARTCSLPELPIIATCSHDTAAAVAGTPGLGKGWAYISSGTWSLLGVETDQLCLSEVCQEMNFTNEIGYDGTVRLLKNVSGLWLIQEARRIWKQEGHEYSYAELAQWAAEAPPFRSLIDPMAPLFLAPEHMIQAIQEFCRKHGEPVPNTPGELTRCIYESLALLYRYTLDQLEQLTSEQISRTHIVGGGSHNRLLNQFTADATGRLVLAGPAEATALGNILIQALTLGHIPSLDCGRQWIAASSGLQKFTPLNSEAWNAPLNRFRALKQNNT